MNFKQFSLLKEGGNAFPTSSNIPQNYIPNTLKQFEKQILLPVFKLTLKDVSLLGSALKKATPSGDLDLGIPEEYLMRYFNEFDPKELLKKISSKLPISNKISFGGYQIYTEFPQYDDKANETDKMVQIDLMIGNLEWMQFGYHSPKADESKYKGAYRNLLLQAIARETTLSDLKDKTGKVIERTRYVFNMGKGLLKAKEVLKKTKFEKVERENVTDKPDEIAHILLGPKFSKEDTLTFERLWKAINSPYFENKKKLNNIVDEFKKGLEEKNLSIPSEVE